MKNILIILIISNLTYLSSFSQKNMLEVLKISQNSLQFKWGSKSPSKVLLKYGITQDLELGTSTGLSIDNLQSATFYYVKAVYIDPDQLLETDIQLFSTASKSSGDITIYFNQWVNNGASSLADAIYISAFEDTIVAYIDRAQTTLDICNYNTGSLTIVNAVNSAETRGVTVRYIAAYNTGTNNSELTNLSATIPLIQRPDDGKVMHNKFIIIDSNDPSLAKIITGSTNHTDNSCHQDYNNLVIIEDQSLALAYKTEFEEMWGGSGVTPNTTNAKFGAAKTDNTPHSFNIGGKTVELYFSPSDGTTAHIESAILSANTDMQFAMLTFINNDLGDAVISIYNSGVSIKGIIENIYYLGSEYPGLSNAGVDVISHFSEPYFLHHKYGIIDANNTGSDPQVITGSHNWTNSAENDYDENTLIIHDAEIANMYYEEFVARCDDLTGTSILQNIDNLNPYPNPFSEYTVIEYSGYPHQQVKLNVFNSIGKRVKVRHTINAKNIIIERSNLASGIYYYQLTSNDFTKNTGKLIIK